MIEKILERLRETDIEDIQMVVSETLVKYGFPRGNVVQNEIWDALDGLSTNKFAIKIVQEVAKDGPWILCSKRLPEENKLVLIYAESTARGGSIRRVAQLHNGFWFVQTASDTLGLIGQYKVIKWAELPEV